jgi:hypothetical protein
LLADQRGILVPFEDSQAIAREVAGLLRDSARRHAIGKNAYKLGREMVWKNVARLYMSCFEQARLQDAVLSRRPLVTKSVSNSASLPSFRNVQAAEVKNDSALSKQAGSAAGG